MQNLEILNTRGKKDLIARLKKTYGFIGEIEDTVLESEKKYIIKVADLELNDITKEIRRDGRLIPLTPKEYDLLYFLMINTGEVITRDNLLNKIWLYSSDAESRVVDVYIGYLRKKIDSQFKKKLIHSIRGFGYTVKE